MTSVPPVTQEMLQTKDPLLSVYHVTATDMLLHHVTQTRGCVTVPMMQQVITVRCASVDSMAAQLWGHLVSDTGGS